MATRAQDERRALDLPLDAKPIDRVTAPTPTSFAPSLKKATPAVVAVYTAEVVRVAESSGSLEEELFRRFFGQPLPRQSDPEGELEERKIPQGTGSGVIVSGDGYILTNNHVVMDQRGGNADEILVRLNDGRELTAKIVGRDPKTDVAVLKVDASDLPAINIADSDNLAVGDIVFAIGNPLGVGITVTQGIVSAKNRAIGIYGREGYESFIQTDAAINQGNSGGALVDTEGRLIGLNSAIVSGTGGNIGIGFAIPSNLAVSVTRQLTEFGEVRRGLLGVNITDVSPDLAQAFGLESANGVLIDEVEEGSAADEAGLKRGDVILSVDGKPVRSANQLRIRVAQTPPGTELKLGLMREKKRIELTAIVGDQATFLASTDNELLQGITVASLDDERRRQYRISDRVDGLVVTEVKATSPYARFLREGSVILEVNDRAVATAEQARDSLQRGVNKLYIYDRGRTGYIAIRTE